MPRILEKRFGRYMLIGFAAVLPIITAFLLRVPRILLGNFTDAVFYLAYARHFDELILRYGFPYYATRFGGILPDAISGQLLGEINGIWILRYALSAAVSASLYLFFRKRYGVISGIIASLLWCLNPAALRLLCTTYVDSTAVPFLILGCCLFASGWGGFAGSFIAGVLVALAASAHLYAAFALLFLAPWFIVSHWKDKPLLLEYLSWMVGGFLTTFVLAWLWYWMTWGMPALFSPTIEVMKNLGGGQTALWKKPLSLALAKSPAWFAPLALLVPLVFMAFRGSLLIRGVTLSLLASIGFFWGGDLFGSAYVLSMPFYYSFLLPVTILAGATLCGELLVIQQSERSRILLFLGLGVAVIAAPFSLCYRKLFLDGSIILVVILSLRLFVNGASFQKHCFKILGILAIACASICVTSTAMFSQVLGQYPRNDIPVLELATKLRQELPKASKDGAVMRFWYDDDIAKSGGADRRMIASFWLHPFGKLIGAEESYVPFAVLSSQDVAAIEAGGIGRIVIFDQDPLQVSRALDEIQTKALPFHLMRRVSLSAPSDAKRTLEVAILERNSSPSQVVTTPLNLHQLQVLNGGEVIWRGEVPELISSKIKGWYFAKLPLEALRKGEGIRVQFQILSGNIRFALNDQNPPFAQRLDQWPTPSQQEIVLSAPYDLDHAWLSLHSMYPSGSRSSLIIQKIEKTSPATQSTAQ